MMLPLLNQMLYVGNGLAVCSANHNCPFLIEWVLVIYLSIYLFIIYNNILKLKPKLCYGHVRCVWNCHISISLTLAFSHEIATPPFHLLAFLSSPTLTCFPLFPLLVGMFPLFYCHINPHHCYIGFVSFMTLCMPIIRICGLLQTLNSWPLLIYSFITYKTSMEIAQKGALFSFCFFHALSI